MPAPWERGGLARRRPEPGESPRSVGAGGHLGARALELGRALRGVRLGHKVEQDLARRVVDHVVGGAPEGAVGDTALPRCAEDDHLRAARRSLIDDRPSGLPRGDHVRRELNLELVGDERRRPQHLVRLLTLMHKPRVERQIERHLDHVEAVDGRLLLGRQLAGEHHHLICDTRARDGHQDLVVIDVGLHRLRHDDLGDTARERVALRPPVDDIRDETGGHPYEADQPAFWMGRHNDAPHDEGAGAADDGKERKRPASERDADGRAEWPGRVGLLEPKHDYGDVGRCE